MDVVAQTLDHPEKKSMSGRFRDPAPFRDSIVPSVPPGKGGRNPAMRAHSSRSQAYHVDKPIVTANVFHKGKHTPEPTARVRLTRPCISLAEQLKRIQAAEREKQVDDAKYSGGEASTPTPALPKVPIDEEPSAESSESSSEEPSDTEASSEDEEYLDEDYDNDDYESTSHASSTLRQESRPLHGTSRKPGTGLRGKTRSLKQRSRTTAPKRKTIHSRRASANGKRVRKRAKIAADEDFEQDYEGSGNDEDEEDFSVSPDSNRLSQAGARRPELPPFLALFPSPRHKKRWTKKEDAVLFSLLQQGKSWEYIATIALGRTVVSTRCHWAELMDKSSKGHIQGHLASAISATAKMSPKKKYWYWSKEEDDMLVNLRAEGKTVEYISETIPGRPYQACKACLRNLKEKGKGLKNCRPDGKRDPSQCQDVHAPASSQLDQEGEEADSDATFKGHYPDSSRDENPPIAASVETPPTKHSYLKAVVVREKFRPTAASKTPQVVATSTQHRSRLEPTPVAKRQWPSTGTTYHVPPYSDPPDPQPVITTGDVKVKKEPSSNEDQSFRGGFEKRRTREPGPRHRSNSFPL